MLAIYAAEVCYGTASFELEPPDLVELTRRHGWVVSSACPG